MSSNTLPVKMNHFQCADIDEIVVMVGISYPAYEIILKGTFQ